MFVVESNWNQLFKNNIGKNDIGNRTQIDFSQV